MFSAQKTKICDVVGKIPNQIVRLMHYAFNNCAVSQFLADFLELSLALPWQKFYYAPRKHGRGMEQPGSSSGS
jgi:hypothetical protein